MRRYKETRDDITRWRAEIASARSNIRLLNRKLSALRGRPMGSRDPIQALMVSGAISEYRRIIWSRQRAITETKTPIAA